LLHGEDKSKEIAVNDNIMILAHFTRLKDPDGIITGAIGVFRDISERWRLEQAQREFIATVSHELRTPLTTIQGFAEALSDGVIDKKNDIQRSSSIIVDESRRLNRLVGDLLDLTRMESGYFKLSLAPLKLDPLITRVARKMERRSEAFDISVSIVPSKIDDVVLADEDRIEQVLINLISNALQYSGSGSVVEVGLEDEGDFIECYVSDNGPGIPITEREHIWKRFRRGLASTDISQGNSGLGLAIVKQIVELHGGQVALRPGESGGSRFSFTLPKMPEPINI
jgi:two-component system sensor histidine kinase ResE